MENLYELKNEQIKFEKRMALGLRREYVRNEINGYYAYKSFIQMLIERLYDENDSTIDNILDREIAFILLIEYTSYPKIKTFKDDGCFVIKLLSESGEHFKEFLKLFIERNNLANSSIYNNYVSVYDELSENDLRMKFKIKDLIDICYREIQGFEYTDKLIEEIAQDENIELGKDSENPLTLKIE